MDEVISAAPSLGPQPEADYFGSGGKPCHVVPCPSFQEGGLPIEPWIPTVDELRQAGCAIAQPDGTHYSLRDGAVVHVGADGKVLADG